MAKKIKQKQIENLPETLGSLPALTTNHKTDLVGAINEVNGKAVGNKTLLDWMAEIKPSVWSRVLEGGSSYSGVAGESYLLNLRYTRGSYVTNFTFLITCTHAGGIDAGTITQLSGNKYSNFKIRIVSNGYVNHFIEILDNTIPDGNPFYYYKCSLTKISDGLSLITYSNFNDGSVLPNGYHISMEIETKQRSVVSENFVTQNYGSAEDWWNASQQAGNKANADGSNITNIGNWQSQFNVVHGDNSSRSKFINENNLNGYLESGFYTVLYNNGSVLPTGNTYNFMLRNQFAFVGNTAGLDILATDSTTSAVWVRVSTGAGMGPFRMIWDEINFNPASKVDVMENAIGVGFSNGSFNALPYIYHKTGGYKILVTAEYLFAQDYASVTYVNQQIASIPIHNGQLTVNTTADLVGGYVYLPSGNITTTLGLATHVLNAIADGQAAYNIIQNSNFAPNNGYDYIPTGGSQTIQPTATKTTVAIQGANVTITLLDGVNDGDECSITTCGGQQYYVDGTIIDKCGNQLHEAQTSTLWWWHQKDNVWYQAI